MSENTLAISAPPGDIEAEEVQLFREIDNELRAAPQAPESVLQRMRRIDSRYECRRVMRPVTEPLHKCSVSRRQRIDVRIDGLGNPHPWEPVWRVFKIAPLPGEGRMWMPVGDLETHRGEPLTEATFEAFEQNVGRFDLRCNGKTMESQVALCRQNSIEKQRREKEEKLARVCDDVSNNMGAVLPGRGGSMVSVPANLGA